MLQSTCPATGAVVWEGPVTGARAVKAAVERAAEAFAGWSTRPVSDRIAIARAFEAVLEQRGEELARAIAQESGKPLWEAQQEVLAMRGKIELSIAAQAERAGEAAREMAFGRAVLRHRAHGVMAVFGPYNFPGHLPNGHIVPALLAGDTIVFKPSEETPMVGALMADCWAEASLPEGVLEVVQGGKETGMALADARIQGLLFTGSAATGAVLRRQLVDRPEVILALELGGNNPLIAWDGEPAAVASIVVQSAFISAGQRCTCARRLILPDNAWGDEVVKATASLSRRLTIGAWDEQPEPSMGPLVSVAAAARTQLAAQRLVASGARTIMPLAPVAGRSMAFLAPAIFDVTGVAVPDEEIFGPVLQVIRVPDFKAAIDAANATRFGLAGGLVSNDPAKWEHYAARARCGVLNWNRPTTGAAGSMPFGGLGASGNHRPSAYYAADYCAYPVASFEAPKVEDMTASIPGLAAAA
ncbi:succinylglutamate-semialdehyde dehydrogenase [Porphyrobacter sp. YT40]|uniref:succinylglutamate-semialdehyde dehydrogenase n=1 Tax=Porphyrobacter sp. YT40 TaxID=2547601 RepID=UPI0025732040|nr:succinylglutamate-semialdehyde dehydrogenase [Porphyrobacter sp. YT40]